MTAPIQPQNTAPAPTAQAPQPPPMPWTPFKRLPTDMQPLIATMRMRKLGNLIDGAKFESWPPEWQSVAVQEYQAMAQVVLSVTPPPPLPKGVTVQAKAADAGTAAQEEQGLDHPAQAPAPHPPTAMPLPVQPQHLPGAR